MKVLYGGDIIAFAVDESIINLFAGIQTFHTTSDKEFLFLSTEKEKKHFFEVLESLHLTLMIMPQIKLKNKT